MKAPIFLFSLPRAGSTLLQKILMAHSQIASTGEPWILLPLLRMFEEGAIFADYGHRSAQRSFESLFATEGTNKTLYHKAVKQLTNTLYSAWCPNSEIYFLDKTPRYYLIIPEIEKLYPEAKFIFLFRNPLAVFASIIKFHGNRNRYIPLSQVDLQMGMPKLSQAYEAIQDKAIAVNYEDLIKNPKVEISRIMDYLDLGFESEQLSSFSSIHLKRGDPFGTTEYMNIDTASLDKWKATLNSKFRVHVAKSWMNYLSDSTLSTQGYERETLLDELDSLSMKKIGIYDLGDYLMGKIYNKLQLNVLSQRRKGSLYIQ